MTGLHHLRIRHNFTSTSVLYLYRFRFRFFVASLLCQRPLQAYTIHKHVKSTEYHNSTKHNKNQHCGYTYWEKAWYMYLFNWRIVLQFIDMSMHSAKSSFLSTAMAKLVLQMISIQTNYFDNFMKHCITNDTLLTLSI